MNGSQSLIILRLILINLQTIEFRAGKAKHIIQIYNWKVLRPLKITAVKQEGFKDYVKSIGKLGGQNKTTFIK